jgi:hypothetical protein
MQISTIRRKVKKIKRQHTRKRIKKNRAAKKRKLK